MIKIPSMPGDPAYEPQSPAIMNGFVLAVPQTAKSGHSFPHTVEDPKPKIVFKDFPVEAFADRVKDFFSGGDPRIKKRKNDKQKIEKNYFFHPNPSGGQKN
jgi:hypothetical protein